MSLYSDDDRAKILKKYSKRRRHISKKERLEIASKTNNRCGYCGEPLPERWHVDHIEPFAKNGTTCEKDNLMAACPQCNRFKDTFTIDLFRRELKQQVDRARRQSVNFRFAEKYGLIKVTDRPIVFYFETLNKE